MISTRLTLGGALFYQSSRVPSFSPDSNGYFQSVPGYVTLSAMARYRISPHASLQLNVENLANAHYYDGLDDNHVNVGAGPSVHLTIVASR